jgi:hypothetical protein
MQLSIIEDRLARMKTQINDGKKSQKNTKKKQKKRPNKQLNSALRKKYN